MYNHVYGIVGRDTGPWAVSWLIIIVMAMLAAIGAAPLAASAPPVGQPSYNWA